MRKEMVYAAAFYAANYTGLNEPLAASSLFVSNKTKMYDKVRKAWRRKTIKIRPDLKSMLLEREAESFALFLSDVIK